MTGPASTPPPPREPDEILTGSRGDDRGDAHWQSAHAPGAGQPQARTWTWTTRERSFPLFAVLLVLLGVGLLIELAVPELSFGSLLILALGGAFGGAWLIGHLKGATVPALVLVAWALSRMATELGLVSGDGWSTFFVGIAFLVGWGLSRYQRVRREWALWMGLILGVIGLADVSDALPFSLDVAFVIPLAIIGVGLFLIYRNRESLRRAT